jgi:hypothetical protein
MIFYHLNKNLMSAPTARNGIITSKKREITITKLILAGGNAMAKTAITNAIAIVIMDRS